MSDEIRPWERQEGESARQYAAFCCYRDYGTLRSIDKAWKKHKGLPEDAPGRSSQHWRHWSSRHDWPARAEAYDAHREVLTRRVREREYDAKLRSHIEQQDRLASATLEASARALKLATDRLRQLDPEMLKPGQIPAYLRAAAAVAEAATNARAQAIGVTELLHILDDGDDGGT